MTIPSYLSKHYYVHNNTHSEILKCIYHFVEVSVARYIMRTALADTEECIQFGEKYPTVKVFIPEYIGIAQRAH